MKLTIIEKVERALLKFSTYLMNSLLMQHDQTREDLNLINSKSLKESALMTEEIFSKDLINLACCTITKFTDFLRTRRNEFLQTAQTKMKMTCKF